MDHLFTHFYFNYFSYVYAVWSLQELITETKMYVKFDGTVKY